MIQANQVDSYYIKFCKAIKTCLLIENNITYHFSDLFIDTNNGICQFNRLWITDNLQLTVIRDINDQIATDYPSYQKTVSFIAQNYYLPGLKKIVQYYIQNCHLCRCAKALKD